MRKIIASVATVMLLTAVPAVAKDKASDAGGDKVWNENKKMLQQEGQNREPGPDGTFQGKPVVQGPADWSSAAASGSDASTGASSGETGAAGRD